MQYNMNSAVKAGNRCSPADIISRELFLPAKNVAQFDRRFAERDPLVSCIEKLVNQQSKQDAQEQHDQKIEARVAAIPGNHAKYSKQKKPGCNRYDILPVGAYHAGILHWQSSPSPFVSYRYYTSL